MRKLYVVFILLLACVFTASAQCKFEESGIDDFSGEITVHSKNIKMYQNPLKHTLNLSILREGDQYQLRLYLYEHSKQKGFDNLELMIKLDNDYVISWELDERIEWTDGKNGSFSEPYDYIEHFFDLTDEDVTNMKESPITQMRLVKAHKKKDYKIKGNTGRDFLKAINCVSDFKIEDK